MEEDDATEAAATAAEEDTAEGEEAGAATDEAGEEATEIEDADATDTSHLKLQLDAANNSPRNFLFLFSHRLSTFRQQNIVSRIGSIIAILR